MATENKIRLIKYPRKETWPELARRPVLENSFLEKPVKKIMEKVREKGDKALYKYTKRFDRVKLKNLAVSEQEILSADKKLPPVLKEAIRIAKQNIETFHRSQTQPVKRIETMPGITCWRKSVGIEKVGIYIPGGTAPLFSTVLMLAVPAIIAGCEEIILCSPPSDKGEIHPAILYTAGVCGVNKIFKAGGAQAIAAMAYGTETIPKVFKIFGPGNQYVTCAKQLLMQDGVAIDMPAGPSELLIIADEQANPDFIAADLLSQAEHGADSQVILATNSETLAEKVIQCLDRQVIKLSRKKMIRKSLKNSLIVLFETMDDAMNFSNLYAPEHLIISCSHAEELSNGIRSAGSVFIGPYSPEAAGDYASGTNHTLPTNGHASAYSGISLDSFVKKISFQQLSMEGLGRISETVMEMAVAEDLDAHKNAVAIRLNK